MPVRDTSAVAFEQNAKSGQSARLRDIIHRAVLRSQTPLTRSEIAERTGLPINTVAGRVNELMKAGMLAELPPVRCPETGRMVHPVTADVEIHRCKNCHAVLYKPRGIEHPVLGYLCSDQCDRENTAHYE